MSRVHWFFIGYILVSIALPLLGQRHLQYRNESEATPSQPEIDKYPADEWRMEYEIEVYDPVEIIRKRKQHNEPPVVQISCPPNVQCV